MDSLTEKIVELEKILRKFYIHKRGTRTKDLGKVLPGEAALKNLKKATANILELWDFYKGWAFSRHLHKHPELLRSKSKISTPEKGKGSLLRELRAHDDRPRGHI